MIRSSQFITGIATTLTIGAVLGIVSPSHAQAPFDINLKVNIAQIGNTNKGENGTIQHWNGSSYDSLTVYVGALSLDVTVPVGGYSGLTDPFDIYCIDLDHTINVNTVYGAFVKTTNTYNAPFNTLSGGAAAYLYNTFAASANTYQKAAGLQLAIWESLYDTSYISSGQRGMDQGNFKINAGTFEAATLTAAKSYLDSWAGVKTSTATWVDIREKNNVNIRKQSMVGPFRVPEPGTLALVALGGLAFVGYGRRETRS
jgi:hypothetical protein